MREATIGGGAHRTRRPEMRRRVLRRTPARVVSMPTDLRHSALSHAVGEVLQDVSDLVQKELRFARAELASNLNAVVWKIAEHHHRGCIRACGASRAGRGGDFCTGRPGHACASRVSLGRRRVPS